MFNLYAGGPALPRQKNSIIENKKSRLKDGRTSDVYAPRPSKAGPALAQKGHTFARPVSVLFLFWMSWHFL